LVWHERKASILSFTKEAKKKTEKGRDYKENLSTRLQESRVGKAAKITLSKKREWFGQKSRHRLQEKITQDCVLANEGGQKSTFLH